MLCLVSVSVTIKIIIPALSLISISRAMAEFLICNLQIVTDQIIKKENLILKETEHCIATISPSINLMSKSCLWSSLPPPPSLSLCLSLYIYIHHIFTSDYPAPHVSKYISTSVCQFHMYCTFLTWSLDGTVGIKDYTVSGSYKAERELILKGNVHPTMKIQSLSTHLHADGETGKVLLPTKHIWSFTARQNGSILLNYWLKLN